MNLTQSITMTPTRRLKKAEREVFERVNSEFIHLTSTDAEQLTQYVEAVVRYEAALKQTTKHPTISVPVVNRSTGNITGEKIVRNPAFTTIKEAQSQMNALARRLMIDAHSAEKRQRMLTKRSRALAASESNTVSDAAALAEVSESQIQTEMDRLRMVLTKLNEDVLRREALWHLTVFLPSCDDHSMDEDIFAPLTLPT